MSDSIRPFLVYIDEYRRRIAAPRGSKVRQMYSKYADLDYIKNRLLQVEDKTAKNVSVVDVSPNNSVNDPIEALTILNDSKSVNFANTINLV